MTQDVGEAGYGMKGLEVAQYSVCLGSGREQYTR